MKTFLLNSKDRNRDGVIWNMIGSMLMAFQSVIFLMILTRTVGIVASGIFTIAYANANLFLNIGKYGVRNYQVSDVKNEYNFKEYLQSRWITTILMLVFSVIYTLYTAYMNQYSSEKTWIIIWMCLFKLVDSIEDVYIGEYQKRGRLDVGAKILAIRMIFTIVVFSVIVIITNNLLFTLIISTCFTTVLEILFIRDTYPTFRVIEDSIGKRKIKDLLYTCFPVALSAFLAFYIGNAPKYAIDAQLSDELQACYGFISMPVFVIGLLNGFVFTPIIYQLSVLWNEKNIKEYMKQIGIQSILVVGITSVCLVGAYLLGVPVLSLLYNTDLAPYKAELLVLLVGGGFLGWSGILNTVITIMRRQRAMLICYGIVSMLALLLSNVVVEKYNVMGASLLYMGLMILLCVCFLVVFIGEVRNAIKEKQTSRE